MPVYKEQGKNLHKCSFHIQTKSTKDEIPIFTYKMGRPIVKLPLISWFFIVPFNFGYVHIINCGLNKCIY